MPAVLLDAYQRYRSSTPHAVPMVVCGIDDPGLPGVTTIKGVDSQTLHTYYAHAELFMFLSLIEGFGFPPLEAMSHGTPVLCSDIAVLREVTRGEAVFVDPRQPALISVELARVLCDKEQMASRREAAMRVARSYDWRDCAQGVLAVLASQGRSGR